MVTCKVCHIEKERNSFNRIGNCYRKVCKMCQANADRKRNLVYLKKPLVQQRIKQYRNENSEKLKQYKRQRYYQKYRKLKNYIKCCEKCGNLINPALYNQRWCSNCKETMKKEYNKLYLANNKERFRRNNLKSHKKQMQTNPLYVLRRRCRSRLNDAFRFKKQHTPEFIGCSMPKLKQHLEKQFKDGMSWENIGDWHIDHIIPLCSATNVDELYRLCHYTNLQPLWFHENCSKASKDKLLGKSQKVKE